MPKRVPNKKYTPGFKKLVVETMRKEKLSYRETAERFGIRHKRVRDWERVNLRRVHISACKRLLGGFLSYSSPKSVEAHKYIRKFLT